jgi:tetratricopeptide (TPR) repeat protein
MLLRLCANHLPEGAPIRVELGRRMLEAGLLAEASRWLLNTAAELLAANDGEAAMLPIRAVLRVQPEHPEARALLEKAQVVKIRRKRRRWHLSIGLSAGLAVSLVALVKFHGYHEAERWIASVSGQNPAEALALLEEQYGEDAPLRIAELRDRLRRTREEEHRRALDDWNRLYREADETCRFGDPLLGFTKALELPVAPGANAATPDATDLLGRLASRLNNLARDLDVPVGAPVESLLEEERLLDMLGEFRETMETRTLPPEAHSFQFRIVELTDEVRARRASRARAREKLSAKEKEKEQDILLATARAHDQASDLERALAAYQRLLESDPSLGQIPELQQEIGRVQAHYTALQRALELCDAGRHSEAEQALQGVCSRPIEHLLPYRVDSLPSGARVTLSDGRVRTTPFTAKSGFGEHVVLRFEQDGFLAREVEIKKPGDMTVRLHRFPERAWKNAGKCEAAPVPSGDDHIVADRNGLLARLDAASQVKWQVSLKTLSGVARTPVFLPNKPGWLLVMSEEGQAWLVQSQSGEVAGPREIGSPPTLGPELTRSGVSVQFRDGRVAVWTDRLEPIFYQADSLLGAPGSSGQTSSDMAVLRRSAGSGEELVSPFNGWKVTVGDTGYEIVAPDGRGFSAERKGEWAYVAWEAPKALVSLGRVWISDAGGLRSYVPDLSQMVPYPR